MNLPNITVEGLGEGFVLNAYLSQDELAALLSLVREGAKADPAVACGRTASVQDMKQWVRRARAWREAMEGQVRLQETPERAC